MMQPPTIDDIRAAAAAHRGRGRPHPDADQPDAVRDHRRRSLAEVREPPVHRRLQGARRAQQIAPADRRGARARSDRRVGRQPCAGGRLSRQAARHSGDHRHAGADADGEGHADRRPRRAESCCTATMFDDAYAKARELERSSRAGVRPSVRRSAGHRRRRARSALEMLEDAPDLDMLVRADRRRRADVGHGDRGARDQAGHRAGRRRGRALSVDEMRDRGLRTCRSAATRWPRASRSSSRAS